MSKFRMIAMIALILGSMTLAACSSCCEPNPCGCEPNPCDQPNPCDPCAG